MPWVVGGFFSHTNRDYGQNLLVAGFESLTGIPPQGLRAEDVLFFSDLGYTLNQFALFGEVTVPVAENFRLTGGLRFYHFSEDKEQIFDGLFGNDNTGTSLVSQPGSTDANGLAPRSLPRGSCRSSPTSTRRSRAASAWAASTIRSTSAVHDRRTDLRRPRAGTTRRSGTTRWAWSRC